MNEATSQPTPGPFHDTILCGLNEDGKIVYACSYNSQTHDAEMREHYKWVADTYPGFIFGEIEAIQETNQQKFYGLDQEPEHNDGHCTICEGMCERSTTPDLLEALKYARRFLNKQDHDTDYVDAIIANATTNV